MPISSGYRIPCETLSLDDREKRLAFYDNASRDDIGARLLELVESMADDEFLIINGLYRYKRQDRDPFTNKPDLVVTWQLHAEVHKKVAWSGR